MSDDVQGLDTPSMLDEKYRVEALLAVGGMGAVYRGTHTKLKKTVAIKVLKRALLAAPEQVERFQREAVAASQIGHEGIIEVTDIGTSTAGDAFLVMEFLEGRDLATCLHDLGPLQPGTAVRLCCEILSALEAAHAKDIIHRDLKPENVFVCKRSDGERLKIVDFGISRMPIEGDDSMRLTTTGMVMGTPYYMSPEQALGDSGIGKAADLYSVGVILYELITGAVPYRATNYNALLHQILLGEYPPPSQLSAITPELEAVIVKAMSTHPEDRYADARSFSEALQEFVETNPTPVLLGGSWKPDTLEDGDPVAATAPTVASSGDVSIGAMKTQCGPQVSGSEVPGSGVPGSGVPGSEVPGSEVPGSDTLQPVVTPAPDPSIPERSRKNVGAIAAVLGLFVIGGTTALLARDGESDGRSRTSAAAASLSPRSGAPADAPEASAPAGEAPLPPGPVVEPALVTMTFAIAPHDAKVYVDGEALAGKSIARPAGSYVIEVRREGFLSQVRTVEVQGDQKLVFVLESSEDTPIVSETKAPESTASENRRGAKKSPRGNRSETRKSKTPPDETPTKNRRFVEDSPYDAP